MRFAAILVSMSCITMNANGAVSYRCTDAKGIVERKLVPCDPGVSQEIIDADGRNEAQRAEATAALDWNWKPKIGMSATDVQEIVERAEQEWRKEEKRDPAYFMHSTHGFNPWLTGYTVNRTINTSGTHEQWVFKVGSSSQYLYFDNGVLTSIQE